MTIRPKIKNIQISEDYSMITANYINSHSTTFSIKDLCNVEEEKWISKQYEGIKEVYYIMKEWLIENYPELII